MTDLLGIADGQRELLVAEAGEGRDDEAGHDDHEGGVSENGAEWSPAEAVDVGVATGAPVMGDHPHAVPASVGAYDLERLLGADRGGEAGAEPGAVEEPRRHPDAGVACGSPDDRKPVHGARDDRHGEQPHHDQERDRGEHVEDAGLVEDVGPTAVDLPRLLQPSGGGLRVVLEVGRHLCEEHAQQREQPRQQEEDQADGLLVEEGVHLHQDLPRGECGLVVEAVHRGGAVRPGSSRLGVVAHPLPLLRSREPGPYRPAWGAGWRS